MMDGSVSVVIQLLRKALSPSRQFDLPEGIDWSRVMSLANGQCVSGICFEAIEQLQAGYIPKKQLLQWFGQTERQRGQYQIAWDVACKLDRLWAAEGLQAVVLKGRAISQFYTVPYHRFSCDLDVFIEQGWDRACELLKGTGVKLGREVYKEVEFTMDDVYVECHRYITPLRGNKHLQLFESYLRSILKSENNTLFEGTTLVCPPLMFTVMLYVEHALGDFLHGKLLLKHIVDWVVLRKQDVDWETFKPLCKKFRFERFVELIDAFADVMEGKIEPESMPRAYQEAFEELFGVHRTVQPHTWFQRRVQLFFDILKNGKKYRDYGYTSMPSFLFGAIWTHYIDKEVKL